MSRRISTDLLPTSSLGGQSGQDVSEITDRPVIESYNRDIFGYI